VTADSTSFRRTRAAPRTGCGGAKRNELMAPV
jgi:hypothetical protein